MNVDGSTLAYNSAGELYIKSVPVTIPAVSSQSQLITASGSFIVPSNVTLIYVTVQGCAGQNDGGTNNQGGAGGTIAAYPMTVTAGETVTIVIASGGSGAATTVENSEGTVLLSCAGGGNAGSSPGVGGLPNVGAPYGYQGETASGAGVNTYGGIAGYGGSGNTSQAGAVIISWVI